MQALSKYVEEKGRDKDNDTDTRIGRGDDCSSKEIIVINCKDTCNKNNAKDRNRSISQSKSTFDMKISRN